MYRLASTAQRRLPSGDHRGRPRVFGSSEPVPAGVLHAYEENCETTLCGKPLSGLRRWPERDFLDYASRGACTQCLAHPR